MNSFQIDNKNLLEKVKDDIHLYGNISLILEKISDDNNFLLLSRCFQEILLYESNYAYKGIFTRIKKFKTNQSSDKRSVPADFEFKNFQRKS